jgi:hypothetical protein
MAGVTDAHVHAVLSPSLPPPPLCRILGMGDMLTLYEKAQSAIKEEDSKRFQERLMANKYDFNDFLAQFKQINNMGGLQVGAVLCCCSWKRHACGLDAGSTGVDGPRLQGLCAR